MLTISAFNAYALLLFAGPIDLDTLGQATSVRRIRELLAAKGVQAD